MCFSDAMRSHMCKQSLLKIHRNIMIINCGYHYTNRKINAAQLHSLCFKKKPLCVSRKMLLFFFETIILLVKLWLSKGCMSMRIWSM